MPISKRLRFEVFKRDSFTCQYCGAQAPSVVLQVDHIQPVSKDGADDIINLVTSCGSCNIGKSNISLSDESSILKRKAQLDDLQERRDQIEMMLEWNRDLVEFDSKTVVEAARFFEAHCGNGFQVSSYMISGLRIQIRKYGLKEVLDSMLESISSYSKIDPITGGISRDSSRLAFSKIGPILNVRSRVSDEPDLRSLYYIRGILRKRVGDTEGYTDQDCLESLRGAVKEIPAEEIRALACRSNSWRSFHRELADEFIHRCVGDEDIEIESEGSGVTDAQA
jgi:hypothetical protein